jgi:ubiquinone/menaquinone biosynthesis C-methylase UbiE
MENAIGVMQAAYDRIAADYDNQWSIHVREPQRRLTDRLQLSPGLRCADIACGTGVDTLEMLKLAAPAEVVGVDCSPAMLESARRRAHSAGFALTTLCQEAGTFIQLSEAASFDVITLRFCLGYLDWRTALPRLPRLLRPGGRIGILTSLASSAPQAYATYQRMGAELGVPEIPISATASIEQIDQLLWCGGASVETSFTHSLRLEFARGEDMASWLQQSGIATHPALASLPPDIARILWKRFAERVECYREGNSVPLDFDVAGVIAVANRSPLRRSMAPSTDG